MLRRQPGQRSFVAVGVVFLVCLLAGLAGTAARRIDGGIERLSVDARFSLRGRVAPDRRVVIVGLDNRSYLSLPRPPLPRALDAELVRRLNAAGAAVIAYDFSFERPTDPPDDFALIRALSQSRRAVVSVTAPTVSGALAPLAGRVPFSSLKVRPGDTGLPIDPDGAVRRLLPPQAGVASFPMAVAAAYAGSALRVPPRAALIDYPGPAGTFPELSLVSALHGDFSPDKVRGRIVVIGPTALILEDRHHVAVGGTMTGAEIHAAAIATILKHFPLRTAAAKAAVGSAFAAAFAAALLLLLLSGLRLLVAKNRGWDDRLVRAAPREILAAAGALGALWLVAVQYAFNHGVVLEVVPPLVALGAFAFAGAAVASAAEARLRLRVRMRFAAHDPAVVSQVLRRRPGARRTVSATDVIGGYQVESEVGRGGMGVVYRARQLRLDRPVALKLIAPQFASDATYRERFVREAGIAAEMAHPYVVPVIDAGVDSGLLFIVMQYVEGFTLAHALQRLGGLEVGYAVRLLDRVAAVLDVAHSKGLVHRDVKPANILLPTLDLEHPFLSDFGVSAHAGGSAGLLSGWTGTVDYTAPEQFDGGAVDGSADVYALAAVLHHCLTGSPPFAAHDPETTVHAHRTAPRPRASRLRSDLPEGIDAVIAHGMALTPAERYPTAGALLADARAVLGDLALAPR